MKSVKYLYGIIALIPLLLGACYYDPDFDEDNLTGDTWYLEKTVYVVDDGYETHRSENYDDEVSMRFYYDGAVDIKTATSNHFGDIYTDWYTGSWHVHHDELTIRLDGNEVYEYEVTSLDRWHLTLVYYNDYTDDDGTLIKEKVEEHYSR